MMKVDVNMNSYDFIKNLCTYYYFEKEKVKINIFII